MSNTNNSKSSKGKANQNNRIPENKSKNNASQNKKTANSGVNSTLKIVIPILIVLAVVAIGVFKAIQNTFPDKAGNAETTVAIENGNPDFALAVTTTLDMEKLKSYGLPILIEFGSEGCVPCDYMAPIISGLNAELQGKAIVRFVNLGKYQNLSRGYDFQYIPTQLLFNADGTPYNPPDAAAKQMDLHYDSGTKELEYTTHTGTLEKEEILSMLKEMGMKKCKRLLTGGLIRLRM